MVVDPYAVRIARPTAMPTIRATVTVEAAMPYSSRPTAATAAVERGVTVAPQPRPNTAQRAAADPTGVEVVQRDIATSAPAEATSPMTVTRRSDRIRTMNPDASAPTAVAPASAPRARR